MAERVTSDEVKKLIDTEISDLSPFIKAANLTVNQYIQNDGLGTALLKEIERWLTAHFVAMRERQLTSETVGDAANQYGGNFGMGLDFTQYGQQVKMLDATGKLANGTRRSAMFKVL